MSGFLTGKTSGIAADVEQISTGTHTGKYGVLMVPNDGGDASEATLATVVKEATFDALVGDVTATPPTNTIIGRLKTIADKVINFSFTGTSVDVNITGGSSSGPHSVVAGESPTTITDNITIIGGHDENNVAKHLTVRSNGAVRTETIPYLWNMKEGNITGHKALHRNLSSIVPVSLVDTLITTGIWVQQIIAGDWSISSDSALDSTISTGATYVELEVITNPSIGIYNRVTVEVPLNGLTPVNLSTINAALALSLYVDNFHVIGVGVGSSSNVGTISIYSAINGTGVILAQILPLTSDMSAPALYSATGESVYVAAVSVGTNNKNIVGKLFKYEDYTTRVNGTTGVKEVVIEMPSGKGSSNELLPVQVKIANGEYIEATANADTAGDTVYMTLYGWRE